MNTGRGDVTPLSGGGLTVILVGSALAPIDLFVVNVALPTIGGELHATASALGWVVTAYGLTFAVLLVLGGRLGDLYGRRRLLVAGLVGFTLTSVGCGLAPTVGALISWRAFQGASAALLVPQALATIHVGTCGDRRTRAVGYYGATGGAAMVLGQLAGGLLVQADIAGTGWRAAFLVNALIGVPVLVSARVVLPETKAVRPERPDLVGAVVLASTLLALMLPISSATGSGWRWWQGVLLAAVPSGGWVFLVIERHRDRAGRPTLLPPSLLHVAGIRPALAVAVPFFVCLGGFLFSFALVTQEQLGLDPSRGGLALAPFGCAFLAASLLAGRLVRQFGRLVVFGGASLALAGLVLLGGAALWRWSDVPMVALTPGTAALGAGLGVVAPAVFRIVLAAVPSALAGAGSGVLATTQQAGTAVGATTVGGLYAAVRRSGPGGPGAWLATLGGCAALLLLVAVLSRRLPHR